MVVVRSQQREVIFAAVQAMYTDVALHPERGYHFPTGRAALDFVGYPADRLARLPPAAVESFAGVGYPFAANVIRSGDRVLDVGAGSGTDLLLARELVGGDGAVIGLDMTAAMLAKLDRTLRLAEAANVRLLEGNAEAIPLPDASVDAVTSNGVLNLVPDKRAAFSEIFRVLRPGGRVQIADIALRRPISDECRADPALWAECVVGATLEDEYLTLLREVGFVQVEKLGDLDYFSASSSPATRSIAGSFGAISLLLRGARPPAPPLPEPLPWPQASDREGVAAPARGGAGEAPGVPGPSPSSRADARDLPSPDVRVDARGRVCGTLEPMLRSHMDRLSSGQVLEILTDDPSARLGLPAWIRLAGHVLLGAVEEGTVRTRFLVRKD